MRLGRMCHYTAFWVGLGNEREPILPVRAGGGGFVALAGKKETGEEIASSPSLFLYSSSPSPRFLTLLSLKSELKLAATRSTIEPRSRAWIGSVPSVPLVGVVLFLPTSSQRVGTQCGELRLCGL